MSTMTVKALVPIFGSNRMLASNVGEALEGCEWVGVPFAGGMCELPYITARTMLVNDLHKHIINLARVVADPYSGPRLYRQLRRVAFHPEYLAEAQREAQECGYLFEQCPQLAVEDSARIAWAKFYFVAAWMGRNGKTGTKDEFSGQIALRWNANGGDSCTRYQNAVKSLVAWRRVLRRCTFSTMDAFEFLLRCEDKCGHGIYADPPFLGPGKDYKHNCGETTHEQVLWHNRLHDCLDRFQHTRIVCRFYDVPLIRDLYPTDRWQWKELVGRKQTNADAPEVLIVRNA